ncbi:MAG: hypothetical protein MZV70_52455 [Desulfobacterales bacterium]|nr:hypothetical protein [Desulfobacterales bacterium]
MKRSSMSRRLLCRIAGGMPATFPYEGDLTHPDLKAAPGKVPQPQSQGSRGRPDQVLDDPGRLHHRHHGRCHELRQLSWRRIPHHGADRHHVPIRHQGTQEAG